MLVGTAVSLLNPWPLKLLVDSVFGDVPPPQVFGEIGGTTTLLVIVALSYMLIYLLSGALDILTSYLGVRFSGRQTNELQKYFYYYVLNMPPEEKRSLETGDYVYRLNEEADNISALIFGIIPSVINNAMMIIAALFILTLIDWQLALVGVLIVPLMYWSIRHFTPRIGQKSDEIAEATGEIYNITNESIDNSTTIQAFNRQEYQVSTLGERLTSRLRDNIKLDFLEGKFEYTNNLTTSLGVAVVICFGGFKALNGDISLGELLVFVSYMSFFYDPLQAIINSASDYKTLMTGVRRVFGVLSMPSNVANQQGKELLTSARGSISLHNVTFRRDNRTILNNVNLEVEAGKKVAFIGPSGGGKSTLLGLLPRFNIQDSGSIYVDGYDIANVSLESLRSQIGYVAQEAELFSGTIRSNIGFGKPNQELDLPDIMLAAKAADAYDFIQALPDNFNTDIGESGDNLSGGQKQRIAIARAYLKDAPILILDEPTSALDHASSVKLIGALRRLMKGKTVLLSTHETALLKDMDEVYVVRDGTVKRAEEYGGVEAYIASMSKEDPANNAYKF